MKDLIRTAVLVTVLVVMYGLAVGLAIHCFTQAATQSQATLPILNSLIVGK